MKTLRIIQIDTLKSVSRAAWQRAAGFLILTVLTGASTGQLGYAQSGTVVTTTFTSPALEGNAWGNSATRTARVYLPPSYDTTNKRYPVVYYLHGGGGDANSFFNLDGYQTANQLIRDGMMHETIIVGVDASNSYSPARYVNSALLGDYEDYMTRDVVNHIDASFRTLVDRDSRGVLGASAGGAGALRYGMLHADLFGAVYTTSAGIPNFSQSESLLYLGDDVADFSDMLLAAANVSDPAADLAGVETPADISASALRGLVFGWAAAYAPNLNNPPLMVDLPFELPSLQVIPDVRDRWFEYDLHRLLEEHASDLSSLRGLALDVGDRDQIGLDWDNEIFHLALVEAGVPHQFEVFSGGHSDRRAERISEALVFISDSLIVPVQASNADFNVDGNVDIMDIDYLVREIVAGPGDAVFDLTGDGIVDIADLTTWLSEAAAHNEISQPYLPGDSNLDGAVNTIDLNILALNWRQDVALWSGGDFTADGIVDSSDLNGLALNWRHSVSVAASKDATVPEPSALLLTVVGLALIWRGSRCLIVNSVHFSESVQTFCRILGLAASLLFPAIQITDAAVIERDWKNPGDGLLTFDDVNNREWLDLTETQAMSVDDVSSQLRFGGEFDGFSHAFVADVIGLAMSAGIDLEGDDYLSNAQPVQRLSNLVDITDPGSFLYIWSSGIALTNEPMTYAIFELLWMPEYDVFPSIGTTSLSLVEDQDASYALDWAGAWLFKPVPEPSSLLSYGWAAMLVLLPGLRRSRTMPRARLRRVSM